MSSAPSAARVQVQSVPTGHPTGRPLLQWAAKGAEYAAIWVPLLLAALHIVGFALWTTWISFTPSTLVPVDGWVGLRNYTSVLATRNWKIAFDNLLIFAGAFVVLSALTGIILAILLDQRLRGENVLRSIFLYPIAVSFVVTGTVWSWLLNPGMGIQKLVNSLGWTSFRFDWIINGDMAIWTIVLAAIWQSSGFAMALFLAGLRSVEADLIKAAQIDGAGPFRLYTRVILPTLWPIIISVMVIQLQFAITTFDLVRALTGGGPGLATQLPALVVYDFIFQRGQLGRGSAAAVMMLGTLLAVLLPYTAWKSWQKRRADNA
jgi:glucose/mannose transport system permease protein